MEMKRLGRTDLQVSVLGVGGHTYPVGDSPDSFCTLEERAQLIHRLVEDGVNYFDTTWLNEVELLADSLKRADIKKPLNVSLQFVDGISDGRWRERLRGEVEMRLKVMGYDSAPLFIMGVGNNRPPTSEIIAACEAMQALKEEGLIRNIGVSCHDLEAFAKIADAIEAVDLIDYMMIRYNWKFQQASDRLFPLAQSRDIGVVAMKVFCWDCGPDNWDKRISVFEPVAPEGREPHTSSLNAAQRSLLWCLQTGPFATTVPSINATWEAEQLLQAVETLNTPASISDFPGYRERLYDADELKQMAAQAESAAVRERAAGLYTRLQRA